MVQIIEDYVSFETAKLLKERGFDEKCNMAYFNGTLVDYTMFGFCLGGDLLYCPTLQMAMKWLRKKYNIHIEPRYFPTSNIYRYVIIHSPLTIENIDSHPQYFNTHEEACEAAIKDCLENLI